MANSPFELWKNIWTFELDLFDIHVLAGKKPILLLKGLKGFLANSLTDFNFPALPPH
jgi:hypothetical protein